MQQCYLRAWQYAKSLRPVVRKGEVEWLQGQTRALYGEFIPNWTSIEFEGFVVRIGNLLDEVFASVEESDRCHMLEVLEGVWRQVLDVEIAFWPDVE